MLPSSLDSARASVRNWTELESLSQPLQGKSDVGRSTSLAVFFPKNVVDVAHALHVGIAALYSIDAHACL